MLRDHKIMNLLLPVASLSMAVEANHHKSLVNQCYSVYLRDNVLAKIIGEGTDLYQLGTLRSHLMGFVLYL